MGAVKEKIQLSPEEDEELCLHALELVSGNVLPFTLKTAVELDLLEIIAKAGPGAKLSAAEVVAQLPTENPEAATMVDRILRNLAANNILTCTVETCADGKKRKYGTAPVCKYLTKQNEQGVSLAPLALLNMDKVSVNSWYHLKDAVLYGGTAFVRANGMPSFKYFGTDPRANKVFIDAMKSNSVYVMKKWLDKYRGFDKIKVLVDVGGSGGDTLHSITIKYPHIKGINFDLPHVISAAPSYPGVEHVSGDMLVSVPKGDAIILKWMVHILNDEDCVKVLKNCYDVLPVNGKVLIIECILPMDTESTTLNKVAYQEDLSMLTYVPGGKERTKEEYEALAKKAGFKSLEATYIGLTFWVVEGTK